MPKSQAISLFIASGIIAGALILIVDRGGVIAWGALPIGVALLAKIRLKPSGVDLGLSIGLAAVPVLAWVGTLYYVISTWETGEVVELVINTGSGTQTARVWVLDIGAAPLVYYDAQQEVAESLLAGKPLQLNRAGEVSTRIPEATQVNDLPADQADLIFEAMESKYGDRVGAADIYYGMLGRSQDRIAVVASLVEE